MILPQKPVAQVRPVGALAARVRNSALLAVVGGATLAVYIGIVASFGFSAPVMMVTAAFAVVVAALLVAAPRVGVLLYLTIAYFIMLLSRFGLPFPVGTVMDAALGLLLVGFFLQRKDERARVSLRSPVNVMIGIWIGYNLLELVNPEAASRAAWVYTVRTVALVALSCFVFQQAVRDARIVRAIFMVWIALCTVGALYAVKQEYLGFAGFEQEWLASDPRLEGLYHIGAFWRKFSIFSDPVSFAYNMVAGSLLCFALTTGPVSRGKKVLLLLLAGLFLTAMLYSGTRGAYVLVPAALMLFFILRFNRRVMIGGAVAAVLFAALVFGPAVSPAIYRFQTAFRPSKDASFNVRASNQKRIQPYILTRPLGGGLGSTGVWGERFSPNTMLAHFPPDSGYVRVAVVQGWIGLGIFCAMMFVILRTGINNYFRLRNPALKSYCLAALLVVFALNLGAIPQEALVQFPLNIYFWFATALIVVLPRIERAQSKLPELSHIRVYPSHPNPLHA